MNYQQVVVCYSRQKINLQINHLVSDNQKKYISLTFTTDNLNYHISPN